MRTLYFLISVLVFTVISCHSPKRETEKFPPEMVSFKPFENNPVFSGTKSDTWDDKIRERGYILHEEEFLKCGIPVITAAAKILSIWVMPPQSTE